MREDIQRMMQRQIKNKKNKAEKLKMRGYLEDDVETDKKLQITGERRKMREDIQMIMQRQMKKK